MIFRYLQGSKGVVLARATCLIAVVALIDWRVDLNISFGFLYLFPILLVGMVLTRWQIVLIAVLCTALSDLFSPQPYDLQLALPQCILVFTSLAGTGLFAFEVTRSQKRELENLRRVEGESAARREAEEQLEFLIDSSPAAIVTMATDGLILRANSAAHRLFNVPQGELPGKSIRRYVPALGRVPLLGETPQAFRTEMQCRGEREQGDVFLANVFFSTYQTAVGPRLAALVVDASEELREREESSLDQLMAGSRILVGAVSHEVRNVCGAITVIRENLVRSGVLNGSKDFEALGALVETLNKIAVMELKQSAGNARVEGADLAETLDYLRIVLEPYCQETGIKVVWNLPEDIPPVWADRHSLLQVLLNLTKNSERALENAEVKRIEISVSVGNGLVSIRVTDTGPGIGAVDTLFQPFQRGAESTGLGLYLSRAFVRSFRGELRHDPSVPGCSFVIDLMAAGSGGIRAGTHATHTPVATR
ncbi:MAG TPA: ATP-binding protein [Bryobacteraceae bacterium]|nr:ATP-binding protein [Bryobacteraceae bacterium]